MAALVLACPVMMLWMMRGHRHGHAGAGREGGASDTSLETSSTAELKRRRDELDRLLERREAETANSIQDDGRHLPLRSGRSGLDRLSH